jgi:hypothetical protein
MREKTQGLARNGCPRYTCSSDSQYEIVNAAMIRDRGFRTVIHGEFVLLPECASATDPVAVEGRDSL